MSSTFKLIDAFNDVKQKVRKMPLEDVQLQILQDALTDFWMAATWRWTVNGFVMGLTAGSADQPITPPLTNILYFIDAIFSDGQTIYPGHVEPFLPVTVVKGVPNKLWYNSVTSAFKVSPLPINLPNNNTWSLSARYKLQVPILTPPNIRVAGTQLFDDEYWPVFKNALLYYAYLWGDDQRAGQLTFANGQVQATGQLGLYQFGLQQMKEREPLLTEYSNKTQEEKKT